jgi:hypothetical protein
LRRGRRIFRAARAEPGTPWRFCTCGACRFDLDAPDGTLYAGDDPLVGVIETIGPHLAGTTISRRFLADRRIVSRLMPHDVELANIASRRAAGFGVTNELSTMTPYDIPRAWAATLHTAGCEGIRYRTRFDTGSRAGGLALFGPAGERAWRGRDEGSAAAPAIVERLRNECNVGVADPPRLNQLRTVGEGA